MHPSRPGKSTTNSKMRVPRLSISSWAVLPRWIMPSRSRSSSVSGLSRYRLRLIPGLLISWHRMDSHLSMFCTNSNSWRNKCSSGTCPSRSKSSGQWPKRSRRRSRSRYSSITCFKSWRLSRLLRGLQRDSMSWANIRGNTILIRMNSGKLITKSWLFFSCHGM